MNSGVNLRQIRASRTKLKRARCVAAARAERYGRSKDSLKGSNQSAILRTTLLHTESFSISAALRNLMVCFC
jgi:hypothetical protein